MHSRIPAHSPTSTAFAVALLDSTGSVQATDWLPAGPDLAATGIPAPVQVGRGAIADGHAAAIVRVSGATVVTVPNAPNVPIYAPLPAADPQSSL
jgi:hypothetical protein